MEINEIQTGGTYSTRVTIVKYKLVRMNNYLDIVNEVQFQKRKAIVLFCPHYFF